MSFLMDTNSFVEPYRLYYQFDIFPQYWDFIKEKIEDGSISILDKVRNEILAPCKKDDLADWIAKIEVKNLIRHNEQEIIYVYAQTMQNIKNDKRYKESAIEEWSRKDVADPWLIAAAKVYHLKGVTFESRNGNLNPINPSKVAKIPDVAQSFNVQTLNLYAMLKELGFVAH